MKIFLSVIALTLALLALSLLLPSPQTAAISDPDNFLPWQIRVEPSGQTEVFGLKPGLSTLADARRKFGDEFELGIIAAPKETGNLEAYYARIELGPMQGRLILTLAASPETLTAMRARAPKSDYMESATRRIHLAPEDSAAADALPVATLSFIPAANLDAETLQRRFGTPTRIVKTSETLTHYLYPQVGLDVVHDAKGKEILQYVQPSEFVNRIEAPLDDAVRQHGERKAAP